MNNTKTQHTTPLKYVSYDGEPAPVVSMVKQKPGLVSRLVRRYQEKRKLARLVRVVNALDKKHGTRLGRELEAKAFDINMRNACQGLNTLLADCRHTRGLQLDLNRNRRDGRYSKV